MDKDFVIELVNEVVNCLFFIYSDVVGSINVEVKTWAIIRPSAMLVGIDVL